MKLVTDSNDVKGFKAVILIHTSVKLVTRGVGIPLAGIDILIHTSVKLVTCFH